MLKYLGALLVLVILILAGYYLLQDKQAVPQPSGSAMTEVRGESVNYFEDTYGLYAEPETPGDYPGVVMIHEWWGLNDNIRAQAKELASEGYRVLAVDLFGTVATTPAEARTQVSGLDQVQALANLKAAEQYLREHGSQRVASLGWCFGGGQSLQLATAAGESLDATVIYYGSLTTDAARLQNIRWPVLGIFGGADQSIPTTTVAQFGEALTQLGVENSIHIYPGVGHAFANPSNANFAPEETEDAWERTLAFLEENLK